jgi:hypothetical protein
MSHSTGHRSGVQRGVDMTVKVKLRLAHHFQSLRQSKVGPINLLRRAGSFDTIWTACRQHGIQTT